MLNTNCIKQKNHQWGVCRQICADCGVQDLITVNLCEEKNAYLCYKCNKSKAVA